MIILENIDIGQKLPVGCSIDIFLQKVLLYYTILVYGLEFTTPYWFALLCKLEFITSFFWDEGRKGEGPISPFNTPIILFFIRKYIQNACSKKNTSS